MNHSKYRLFYKITIKKFFYSELKIYFYTMEATIKTKNPYTYPSYTVMIGKEIIKGFYSKKEAIELKNKLNINL